MNNNPLLKYLIRDKKEDIVHSSGYVKGDGASLGASSAESFEHRMMMEKNRTRVGGYNSSRIVAQAGTYRPPAKKYTPTGGAGSVGANGVANSTRNGSATRAVGGRVNASGAGGSNSAIRKDIRPPMGLKK